VRTALNVEHGLRLLRDARPALFVDEVETEGDDQSEPQ
jgi:hypothetical protein